MKRFFKFIPILLILCFSTVFAENYVHYEWTCVQKDGSNVAQSDTITENKTYTTAKFYSNGGNGLPTNCIGTQTKNTYTVTLNGNGGTVSGGLSYQSDGSFKLPTNVTKTGYTFTGWTGSNGATAQTDVTVSATTSENLTYTANWSINSYYLDLNGWLDGSGSENISGFGTADVYINGELKASGVTDFYQKINYGSTYEIKNIKANVGRTYNGVHSGSLSGTIPASNVGVSLDFTRNTYWVDVNTTVNGSVNNWGFDGFTFDVYINDVRIKQNVINWDTVNYGTYNVYYGDVVKVVPTSHTSDYTYNTPSATVTGSTNLMVTWTIKTLYGYQDATGYSSSWTSSAPSYYKTGTAYYWANYSYKSSSYSCNCKTTTSCGGARREGEASCPNDDCDWRSNGCWWHTDTYTNTSCSTCYNNSTTSCGWTTATSIEAAGCTTGKGLNNRGTQSSKTIYYKVTSWGSVNSCGYSQCASKSATRRLVKSTDNGASWSEY